MMILITYDVETTTAEGRRRLRQVAKQCVNFGQRVQNSVFECVMDSTQLASIKHTLSSLIDPKKDSLRFYYFGNNWRAKVEHIGVKDQYDPEGTIII